MLSPLKWLLILSFGFSLTSLLFLLRRTFSFGKTSTYADPEGSGTRGIAYAFGRGMMPWEKESARKHFISYCAGIIFHISIFGALIYLFLLLIPLDLPATALLTLRIILLLGLLCGLGLLIKRAVMPVTRHLSCPDDFGANIIVDIFLILALVNAFAHRLEPLFFLMAIVLFIYIPFGKIRHCFLFFYVRILFGLFFGRRGVLPPRTSGM